MRCRVTTQSWTGLEGLEARERIAVSCALHLGAFSRGPALYNLGVARGSIYLDISVILHISVLFVSPESNPGVIKNMMLVS